ncbi:MAG: hypothetical protein H5U39_04870 [Deferribacterales bacterium]|nr:hypothetical protein [Deferribacterales bacterium]
MSKGGIPQKTIQISELKTDNIKLRRLFILIDGKKDISELSKLTHQSEEEVIQNIEALKNLNAISVDEEKANTEYLGNDIVEKIECKDFKECLAKTLSLFIGPVAFVIADNNVSDKDSLSYSKMEEILKIVSEEIEKESDRKRFINMMNTKIKEFINK